MISWVHSVRHKSWHPSDHTRGSTQQQDMYMWTVLHMPRNWLKKIASKLKIELRLVLNTISLLLGTLVVWRNLSFVWRCLHLLIRHELARVSRSELIRCKSWKIQPCAVYLKQVILYIWSTWVQNKLICLTSSFGLAEEMANLLLHATLILLHIYAQHFRTIM